MKTKLLFVFIIVISLSIIITSCSTGRIESLERNSDEAIIIAKVKVNNQNEDVTNDAVFLFDETAYGTYHVRTDLEEYFYMKIPLGNHYISRISIGSRSINLIDSFLTFETKESKIYYIGDLSFELDLGVNVGASFGLLGALAYEGRKVVMPPVAIKNNFERSKTYFNNIFKNVEIIYPNLVRIDSSNIGR